MANMFRRKEMDMETYIIFLGEEQIEATDLMDSKSYPWQYRNIKTELARISAWLERAGLKMAALACGNSFTHFDAAKRQENIDKVKNAIHEASELNAERVRIFGGHHERSGGESGMLYCNGFDCVLRGIEACLDEAEKYKIVLALENHGDLPGLSHEIKGIIDYFNSPYLKCMFDCANFVAGNMIETECPLNAYETLKADIVQCHVKDFGKAFGAMSGERCAPYPAGAGGLVPIRQLAARFKRDNIDVYWSLEYEADWQVPELEGVRQSFRYLKDIQAACGILKGENPCQN
jgi:sugar phosphate isomerase/epimerase